MNNQSEFWKQMGAEFDKETDLAVFKTWKAVLSVPLYSKAEFFDEYSKEVLQMMKNSKREWAPILLEPKTGHTEESYKEVMKPIQSGGIPMLVSSNTLKNVHHILSFEQLSGKDITDYDYIVEMGAGCGEVARMIRTLGFEGTYFILDLPQVARISKYYLGQTTKEIGEEDLVYIKDIKEVPLTVTEIDTTRPSKILFIGIWSISEVPIDYRNEIGRYFFENDFLFVVQRQIWEFDNYDYFINKFPQISNTWLRTKALAFHGGGGGNAYVVATGAK